MDGSDASKGQVSLGDLEKPCPECDRTGWYNYGPCGLCYGTGYITTEAGNKVLSLMRHYLPRTRSRVEVERSLTEVQFTVHRVF
jgi:hypothetical protein